VLRPEAAERLLVELHKGALAHGYPNDRWTLPRIAVVLTQTQGVHYHPDHLSRVMRRFGWSVQKPQKKAAERDEATISTWVQTGYPELKKGARTRGDRRLCR
jgi:putative transposase